VQEKALVKKCFQIAAPEKPHEDCISKMERIHQSSLSKPATSQTSENQYNLTKTNRQKQHELGIRKIWMIMTLLTSHPTRAHVLWLKCGGWGLNSRLSGDIATRALSFRLALII
jgi:hypothetical protein